ncbi:MAG: uracil-DNA glycosylase [Candidatus Aminicenantales bacterium]
MEKRKDDRLDQLEEGLRFLHELGVDFILKENKRMAQRNNLFSLHERILNCRLCPLAQTRRKPVPGEGNLASELMFVGEAPGVEEDVQGRPFVGRAGQLLTKIIEAMKFKREEVFITNVVKCRPPQNRLPTPAEIGQCRNYLLAQVERIQPKVIVTLGKVATDFFVPQEGRMTELRGKFFEFGDILILPTFHPSYILRNEANKEIKKLVWQDMQKVMKVLGKK